MFNTGADIHRADLKLYIASKLSKRITDLLDKSKSVGKLLGKITGGGGKDVGSESSWMKDGRIFLLVESSGSLSKPKIKIKNSILGNMQGAINELLDHKNRDKIRQGADLLKGFLK